MVSVIEELKHWILFVRVLFRNELIIAVKYIKKECVKLVINQDYVKMHGQQNM
jgi:ABC-type dipeptide/oligopeptide/nickel transport system permease component